MNIKFNTCIYESKEGILSDKLSEVDFNSLGYECTYAMGDEKELAGFLLDDEIDLLIFCDAGLDFEKIKKILSVIQLNCEKEIIICSEKNIFYNNDFEVTFKDKIRCINLNDNNFDLMLQIELLKIKQNKHFEIKEREARLIVNASITMCEYLLDVFDKDDIFPEIDYMIYY